MLDLRIEDALIITMDEDRPIARSLGVWKGKVIGLDEEIDQLPARETRSLGGAVVVPGFIDAHTHLAWEGRTALSLDLAALHTRTEVLEAIAAHVAATDETAADQWLDVVGYDNTAGIDLRADDLDAVTGSRPTYVVDRSGHAAVVNTATMKRIVESGISLTELGMEHDDQGRPDGRLFESAHTDFRQQVRLPYDVEEIAEALHIAARHCLGQGVTTCAEAGICGGMAGSSPIELMAFRHALDTGRLPVRVQTMIGNDAIHPVVSAPADGVTLGLDLGIANDFGDDRLWLGPLKIWLDGGIQARTAALSEPFEGTDNTGELGGDPALLLERIVAAHVSGWQLALHAIGDRAIDLALDALEACQQALPRPDARHRIEHCGVVRPDQLERLGRSGAIAVLQPEFMWDHGTAYAGALGPVRTHWQYRGRSLLDAGVPIVGSSDRPVAAGTPLQAIQFMVTRRDVQGALIGDGEQISVEEALRAYTTEAARAIGKEGRLGVLRSGAEADLVVLNADPRTVPPEEIGTIAVRETWIAGLSVD